MKSIHHWKTKIEEENNRGRGDILYIFKRQIHIFFHYFA